jgi:1-deoxy-D-xylulose-5-phosphate synthase
MITIEEGSIGGFGSHVANFLSEKSLLDKGLKFRSMVLPDKFIDQNKPELMYEAAGLNAQSIQEKVLDLLNSNIILQKQK